MILKYGGKLYIVVEILEKQKSKFGRNDQPLLTRHAVLLIQPFQQIIFIVL